MANTDRERFVGALTFQEIDRVPLVEWPIRGSTMREWVKQGYPEGMEPGEFFHLDPWGRYAPLNLDMYPVFEEEILESTGRYKIWRDNKGAVRKDFVREENPGFVTRTWLSFPVKDKRSFEEMKRRYVSSDPGRITREFAPCIRELHESTEATHLSIPFLYWTARDWIGFENLSLMFYDDPALLEEIFEFLTDFVLDTLRGRLEKLDVDIVELKEDMAYKGAPMISPAMFRRFMYPHYVRLISYLKSNGVKVVYVDCDGYPGGLIPEFMEAGVDAMSPVEIAAGNDPLKLRERYPSFGMMGGIDKRELAKDRKSIYREVASKVPALLEKGGFIPHVDHAVPHDVPLQNYLYYREVLTAAVNGTVLPQP